MLKLKLQYFGHLMWSTNSLEKTLMMGMIEGKRRSGWQRMRWLDGITDSMDMSRASFGRSWTGRPGVLQSTGSQSQTRLDNNKDRMPDASGRGSHTYPRRGFPGRSHLSKCLEKEGMGRSRGAGILYRGGDSKGQARRGWPSRVPGVRRGWAGPKATEAAAAGSPHRPHRGILGDRHPCPCVCRWSLQSCRTPRAPVGCSPTGSSVHGLLQTRRLDWVATSSPRGPSWPWLWTPVACTAGRFFTTKPPGKYLYVYPPPYSRKDLKRLLLKTLG